MTVDILDILKLIRVNSLTEIETPKILTSSLSYDPKGLLSNEIFGYTTKQRQTTFAYIDLHGYYIHPLVYREVIAKSLKIVTRIIDGSETVSIVNGKLTPDPNGWTGIENLYRHWNEITDYGATPKSIGNVILPSYDRSDVFINKFAVIPPFYHDADVNSRARRVKVNELTTMYSKLITDVQFKINTKTSFDIVASASTMKIQEDLVLIYQYFTSGIAKKRGYIRRRLLSKKVDYGIRSVLTAPSYTGNDIDLHTLEYDRLYIPVSLLTSGAYPFIIRSIKQFFTEIESKITFKPPKGDPSEWEIYEPDVQFDLQYVETLVNNYNKFTTIRFDPLKIKIRNINTDEIAEVKMYEHKVYYRDEHFSDIVKEEDTPITLTDICFRAAYDSCYDRYAMFTRYPIASNYGIFFAQIDVLSTNTTVPVYVQGYAYANYPDIRIGLSHEKMASQFINTVKFSISRLAGLELAYEPVKHFELQESA